MVAEHLAYLDHAGIVFKLALCQVPREAPGGPERKECAHGALLIGVDPFVCPFWVFHRMGVELLSHHAEGKAGSWPGGCRGLVEAVLEQRRRRGQPYQLL